MDGPSQNVNVAEAEKVSRPPICRAHTHIVGWTEKKQRGGFRNGKEWTREEDAILKELYPTGGRAPCLLAMPYRSPCSVASRIRKLGLKNITYVHMDEPECHDAYMRRQDLVFCKAMEAHPEERPSSYTQLDNAAGSRR